MVVREEADVKRAAFMCPLLLIGFVFVNSSHFKDQMFSPKRWD